MGLKECQIIFDNPYSTYYVGQTVTGRVEITLDSPKKVRGVSICFKGECDTRWTIEQSRTTEDNKTENERIDVSGNEEYFKIKYYLVGGQGGDQLELPVGKQIYPFTCLLPPTLPSSFEGEHGHIRYTVKVTLDRPWKFDQETKAAFTVLSPVDLNLNPGLKDPIRITLEKYFCCCWCKSGPLTCVISLPCTGYVPGQNIPIVAEVDNISNVEVLNVHFALQKVVTYHSQIPRKETKKTPVLITELQVGPVAAHASNTWNNNVQVPPLPPSNLTNCSLIDLDYELQVEVRVAGFHTNLTARIPITIGTVPLVNMVPATAPPAEHVAVEMNPGDTNSSMHLGWVDNKNSLYPALSPPTLIQSPYGASSIQDNNDNQHIRFNNNSSQYSPMYPVYNFANNPQ